MPPQRQRGARPAGILNSAIERQRSGTALRVPRRSGTAGGFIPCAFVRRRPSALEIDCYSYS